MSRSSWIWTLGTLGSVAAGALFARSAARSGTGAAITKRLPSELSPSGLSPSELSPSEQGAIEDILRRLVEAHNRHDVEAWAELFTDDMDDVDREGALCRGKAENIVRQKALHEQLRQQDAQLQAQGHAEWHAFADSVRLLLPGLALVHATWHLSGYTGRTGEQTDDLKGIMTLVLVKRSGRWKIRSSQSTVTSAKAPLAR
jgi:uncharacterized protein (TIGR02246 family)